MSALEPHVIVCFKGAFSLLLQVCQANAEGYLQAKYPIATNIVYLPGSFYSIDKFLHHKANGSIQMAAPIIKILFWNDI